MTKQASTLPRLVGRGVSHVHGTGTLSLNILAVLLRTGNFYASRTLQLLWLITCHTSSLLLSVIKLNCKSLRGVSVLLALWLLVMAQMQLIRSGDVKENPVPQKKQAPCLGPESLNDVRKELLDASTKWYDIGLELRLRTGVLDNIQYQYQDASTCLREMLRHWLKKADPCPTWKGLANALESRTVEELRLAQQLRTKKYKTEVAADPTDKAATRDVVPPPSDQDPTVNAAACSMEDVIPPSDQVKEATMETPIPPSEYSDHDQENTSNNWFLLAILILLLLTWDFSMHWLPLTKKKWFPPAILRFGFFGGILFLTGHFLKSRVVRVLLAYDGWLLHPECLFVKLWHLLRIGMIGRKMKKTGQYQDYLPSLPVPPLKSTCKKYLDSVRPLLTPEEYQETNLAVQEFQRNTGLRLHLKLQWRSMLMRNWMATWWKDHIYLQQRTPIPFSSNYFALGKADITTPHQLDRAAMMIYTSVKFHQNFRDGKIETYMIKEFAPCCMDGYKYLQMTARIPGEDTDRIAHHANDNPQHFVICRKGKYFRMEVLSKTGQLLPPKGIRKKLEKVMKMAGDEPDTRGVAAFTALPRAKWAKIRKRMEKSATNRQSLYEIDSCHKVICLDDEEIPVKDLTERGKNLFHGNGYNRWWDKSVQLIVLANGVAGANSEHTVLDATVAGQLWEYMLNAEEYDENGHVLDREELFPLPDPTELRWELDAFRDDLKRAKRNVTKLISDNDIVVKPHGYGKAVPKKYKLSPDGWFQMAIQLAYYRMYKKLVLTYEAATTRLYHQGRTETIRPISDHCAAFVKAMDNPKVPRDEVKALLKKAIEYQCQYKLEAMRGLGVDRYLFGIYVIAKGMDPLPRLFLDKAFNLSIVLSTSQTPVRYTGCWTEKNSAIGGGFGTFCDEGYGICYTIVGKDTVNWTIHSKRSCPTTDSNKYFHALQRALMDMRDLYAVYTPEVIPRSRLSSFSFAQYS